MNLKLCLIVFLAALLSGCTVHVVEGPFVMRRVPRPVVSQCHNRCWQPTRRVVVVHKRNVVRPARRLRPTQRVAARPRRRR